jgi:hypothetical protein
LRKNEYLLLIFVRRAGTPRQQLAFAGFGVSPFFAHISGLRALFEDVSVFLALLDVCGACPVILVSLKVMVGPHAAAE